MNVRDALRIIQDRNTPAGAKPVVTHRQAVILAAALADGRPLHPEKTSADAAVLFGAEELIEDGTPVRLALRQARIAHADSSTSSTPDQHDQAPKSWLLPAHPEHKLRERPTPPSQPTGNVFASCARCDAGVGDEDLTIGYWNGRRWSFTGYGLSGSKSAASAPAFLCCPCAVRLKYGLIDTPAPEPMRREPPRLSRHGPPLSLHLNFETSGRHRQR